MKLLIITQKVDRNDPILGFFHRWIEEFAKHFESIVVICLELGTYDLPANVRVLSLGKENKVSRISYIRHFYSYIWKERKNYNAVFVHMNQEYVLLAGWLWRMWMKKVTMWRNHHAGSSLTDVAAYFCTKVFCTSRFSYTAKYKKTVLMPVGVDLENFKPIKSVYKVSQSVLFLGRISPVKRPDILANVLIGQKRQFPNLTGSIYGDASLENKKYYEKIKENVNKSEAESYIKFYKGIPNTETAAVYSAHDIFVNLSSSGMYDKTIFEAIACGCIILASNDNLRGQINEDFIFKEGDLEELTAKLNKLLNYSSVQKQQAVQELGKFVQAHSLENLSDKLFKEVL